MEKHMIYDPDFEELFYYEHKYKSHCVVWGRYISQSRRYIDFL